MRLMCNKIEKQIGYLKSVALKHYIIFEVLHGITYQLQVLTISWCKDFLCIL